MKILELEKYKVQFEKLKNENHFYRLGKLFQTESKNYFYDVGTGKIFELNKEVYEVLYYILKMMVWKELNSCHYLTRN